MHMMTWQQATRKQITRQQHRITGRHLAQRSRGITILLLWKKSPAHKKQAALQEIFNFVQFEEESLPQACGRLLQLLNAFPEHPLKKK